MTEKRAKKQNAFTQEKSYSHSTDEIEKTKSMQEVPKSENFHKLPRLNTIPKSRKRFDKQTKTSPKQLPTSVSASQQWTTLKKASTTSFVFKEVELKDLK